MTSVFQNIPSEVVAALIAAAALILSKGLELLYNHIANKKQKAQDFSNLNKDYEIDKLLWEKLKEYEGDRIYLCQFHNGGKYQSGMSMRKFTMTNEMISDKVEDPSIPFFKDRLISEFTFLFKELVFEKKYECEDSSSEKDPLVKKTLEKFNNGSFYLYLILDINKAPLGYVGLHYMNKHILSKDKRDSLANFSQSLGALIKAD